MKIQRLVDCSQLLFANFHQLFLFPCIPLLSQKLIKFIQVMITAKHNRSIQ